MISVVVNLGLVVQVVGINNMIIFITLRILDVITTFLNVNNFGWDIESNPWMKFIGEKGLFIPYQIGITVIALYFIEKSKYKKQMYSVLSLISIIAVLINSYCFFFIR